MRLECWNADGVRDRRLELEHILGHHGVDICLLNETHLFPEEAFRFANYVCHRTDRNTQGGGTAILFRRDIDHYAVPVPDLKHLEATAIQTTFADRPVNILAVYLSPCRPLIKRDLSACLDGGLPFLMEGDLNAKHVDWNSRLITTRGRLLRDYADRMSCLIYSPNSPTHHYPLQPICHSRCLGYHLNQEPCDPGESDCLLGTQLGPPPSTDRHYVSLKLSDSP